MRQAPVALMTGAPGSGKTTLLDAALRSGALARTTVMVNDTGTGSAGNPTYPRLGGQVRILPGGCVCCKVRDDLWVETVVALVDAARADAAVTGGMQSVALQVVGNVVAPPAFLWRDVPASRVHFIARGLEPGDVRPPWPTVADLAVPLPQLAVGVYLR